MCRFCKEYCTGGRNDSLLIKSIKMNGVEIMSMDVFINDDELELYVDEVREGVEITKKKRRINYCPMCGEKLAHKS